MRGLRPKNSASRTPAGSAARRSVPYDPKTGLPRMKLEAQGRSLLRGRLVDKGVPVVDPIALNLYERRHGGGENALSRDVQEDEVLLLISEKDRRALQEVDGYLGALLRKSIVGVHLPPEFPGKRFSEVVDAVLLTEWETVKALIFDEITPREHVPAQVEEVDWLASLIRIFDEKADRASATLALAQEMLNDAGMEAWGDLTLGTQTFSEGEDLADIIRSNEGDDRLFLMCMWLLRQAELEEISIGSSHVDQLRDLAKKIETWHIVNDLGHKIGIEPRLNPFGREVPLVGGHRLKTFVPNLTPDDEKFLVENA